MVTLSLPKSTPKSKTPTYHIWQGMKRRCLKTSDRAYRYYGGRGIKICSRWLESFDNFLADMGERPPGLSIDRIDNDGDYCLENCRWATPKEQANNTSGNVKYTINGATHTLSEWCDIYNLPYPFVFNRLQKGWSVLAALTRPRTDTPRFVSPLTDADVAEISRLRQEGYSQLHIAQRLGLNQTTVGRWCKRLRLAVPRQRARAYLDRTTEDGK